MLFLTVSKRASRHINSLIIANDFQVSTLLSRCLLDDGDHSLISLYQGLRIMITRNLDKINGVVNGQRGTIEFLRGNAIQVLLLSGKRVYVHPVTHYVEDNTSIVFYPIVPCYSVTICKVQGQTQKSRSAV